MNDISGIHKEHDAYVRVCSLCEDIKELFCNFGRETEVIKKAEEIAKIAKDRRESLINNTLLNVVEQMNRGGPMEITLRHDEARLVKQVLEQIIKQNYEIEV